jgi:cellobiose epimerase
MPTNLTQFRQEVHQEYFRILDYWQKYSVDEAQGGFYGQVNGQNQAVANAPKSVVINSRILWSFATAYLHFGKAEHLKMAERAFDYLKTYFIDPEHGGVFWSVKADGQPDNTKKQMYGHAFVVYAMSEYYRASKRQEALDLAIAVYEKIEKYSYDPQALGYIEAFERDWSYTDDYILCRGKSRKSMNTHLHLLEAFTNLYRVWPGVKPRLKSILEVMMHKVVDPKTQRMNLFFEENWTPTSHAISYGHDIEASWLIWEAAEVLDDPVLKNQAKLLCGKMAKAALSGWHPDGGMDYEYDPISKHLNDERSWWVICEACVGFLNAYQLKGKVHFLEKSMQCWTFIKMHLLDLQNGEWYGGVKPDGTKTGRDKVTFWKGPYHNSRMCLEVWRRLGH